MKWFHLIGVSGKTTANIARVFQEKGWFVTGSDSQFLPPASNLLDEYKINSVQGYFYEHLNRQFWEKRLDKKIEIDEHPNLVLFISHLTNKNKEYLYAKKLGLDVRPYAKILNEYLIKEESLVVAGSAGKTTTTSLLVHLFKIIGEDPSYMVGAEVLDFEDSLVINNSKFSIMEGDEYHNPDKEIEGRAKFFEYKPKYLILTNIGWEHHDIFSTQESYINEFNELCKSIPENGVIVANSEDQNIDLALKNSKAKIIRYGIDSNFQIKKLEGKYFSIIENNNQILRSQTNLIGEYNLSNILSVFLLFREILNSNSEYFRERYKFEDLNDWGNIQFSSAVESFFGPKKRLEVKFKNDNLIIIDDFGVTPDRALNSFNTLKQYYSDFEIISVFEPNSGSRTRNDTYLENSYKKSFKNILKVLIPPLSINNELMNENEIMKLLKDEGIVCDLYDENNILEEIRDRANKKTLIIFFSSYKLTKNIDELIKLL